MKALPTSNFEIHVTGLADFAANEGLNPVDCDDVYFVRLNRTVEISLLGELEIPNGKDWWSQFDESEPTGKQELLMHALRLSYYAVLIDEKRAGNSLVFRREEDGYGEQLLLMFVDHGLYDQIATDAAELMNLLGPEPVGPTVGQLEEHGIAQRLVAFIRAQVIGSGEMWGPDLFFLSAPQA